MHLLKKKNKVFHLTGKKYIFHKFGGERTKEMEKLHNKVNFENLIYHFKGPIKDADFNDFMDAETLFNDIKSKLYNTE